MIRLRYVGRWSPGSPSVFEAAAGLRNRERRERSCMQRLWIYKRNTIRYLEKNYGGYYSSMKLKNAWVCMGVKSLYNGCRACVRKGGDWGNTLR